MAARCARITGVRTCCLGPPDKPSGADGVFGQAEPLRRRDAFGTVLALGLLACGLALGGWAWRLDQLLYDLGLSLNARQVPDSVVIVAIDDRSIDAIGRWPWSRAVHATLLQRLAAARPRAVALDLVLSEPDADPRQDALLARALQHAAPVVMPLAWQAGAGGAPQLLQPLLPALPLRDAALLGVAEASVDPDGVLRHGFLHAGPAGGVRWPHVALALLQAGGGRLNPRLHTEADPAAAVGVGAEPPAVRNPRAAASATASGGWQRDGRFLIRFAGPPGHVPRVSYVDVLAGRIAPDRLAGRTLLVGMTAQGLGDTLATPVNARHQAMPGVEVLANTLLTLERGDAVRALPPGWLAAGSTLLLALLVAALGRVGPRAALPLALGSAPLALAAALLLLDAGWWCSPVPYAAGALLAYPLWSWRRLEHAMAGLDREIGHLAAEPALARRAGPGERTDGRRETGFRSGRLGADFIDGRLATLQHAGAALREAHAFLAEALAAMPTAMLVADSRGQVLLANHPAAALFEVEAPAEMVGLDLARLLGEFDTDAPIDWPAWLRDVATAAPAQAVAAVGLRQGSREWLLHAASAEQPADKQGGRQRRLIVAIADIGAVRAAQREREQTLAFVSHDLRSPAHSIVLLAQLNLEGALSTPRDALLHEVRRLAARTLELSDDFVRASQVRTLPLQPAPLLLPALLHDAVADLRPQALAGGIALDVRGPDTTVHGLDRALVARAVANLVSNAVRASPPGGSVVLRAAVDGLALVITVQDQGPGLDAEQLAQLALGDRGAPVRSAQGVGLGLLFVQRVAARHGGRLAAVTGAGGGACFELRLQTTGDAGPTRESLSGGSGQRANMS